MKIKFSVFEDGEFFVTKLLKYVDFNRKTYYNKKACKWCDEVGCGYRPLISGEVGNSYGVCHGKDQAVSFIKLRVLILRFHAELRILWCSTIEHQGTFIASDL